MATSSESHSSRAPILIHTLGFSRLRVVLPASHMAFPYLPQTVCFVCVVYSTTLFPVFLDYGLMILLTDDGRLFLQLQSLLDTLVVNLEAKEYSLDGVL